MRSHSSASSCLDTLHVCLVRHAKLELEDGRAINMAVAVRCPKCSRQFAAPEETQGWTVPCPGCGASIKVPPAPPRGARAVAELLDEDRNVRSAQPQAPV